MSLRSKLVTGMLLFTFALVAFLSVVFLSEVLRERIAQTASANDVLLHALLGSTRTALQQGLAQTPPEDSSEAAFEAAVTRVLQTDDDLHSTLTAFTRYSPDVQEAFVSGANGRVLISSNPTVHGQRVPHRRSFADASGASLRKRSQLLFGKPEALDISLPLERNGASFLVAHLAVRSTFLREAYAPWLHTAALVCAFALGGSLLVAAALSAAALRPIERIERELHRISGQAPDETSLPFRADAVERVTSTISRLDAQIRSSEQTRSEMATNLNSMLYALKDGVMLFTEDWRVVTASDAITNFLSGAAKPVPGTRAEQIFPPGNAIGDLLADMLAANDATRDHTVQLEDGRTVEVSVDRGPGNGTGALLTLHDVAAEQELGRELQVSQRLASIGRLMTGVGHEVKNPINAMVVHLELLRGKLAEPANVTGAQRHVEVLASEMSRLDRVVQTLADFSRPIEPVLREQELLPVVQAVIALIAEEAAVRHIAVRVENTAGGASLRVRCDEELLRQALLNIALNAMQAMPQGGTLEFQLSYISGSVLIAVRDTGTGIAPEALDRIFDLYFTTKPAGSGIGLAMTYRIVQMHSGLIQVKSETSPKAAERGSTFTIQLPLLTRGASVTRKEVLA